MGIAEIIAIVVVGVITVVVCLTTIIDLEQIKMHKKLKLLYESADADEKAQILEITNKYKELLLQAYRFKTKKQKVKHRKKIEKLELKKKEIEDKIWRVKNYE